MQRLDSLELILERPPRDLGDDRKPVLRTLTPPDRQLTPPQIEILDP